MSDHTQTAPEKPVVTSKVTPSSTSAASGGRDSIPDLIRQLAGDVSTLTSKEMALAKAEFREAANDAKKGVGGIATGGGVAFAGLLFLLLSATYGLAEVVPPWAAALIVGAVVLVIGLVMVSGGKKKLEADSFVPKRTIDSVQKDTAAVKRAAS